MAEVGTQREDMASDLLVARSAVLKRSDGKGVAEIMNARTRHARTLTQTCGTHELQEDTVDRRIA